MDGERHIFEVWSQCFHSQQIAVSAREAAPIMGVSLKTAQNYESRKCKADPVRLKYLRAVVGRKLIPEEVPLWWDAKTETLCCDAGWSFGAAELLNLFYLHELRRASILELKAQIKRLQAELEHPKQAARALPANVIPFKCKDVSI
ncbi:MAG: hypothetical protein AB9Q19_00510 [Candidatus Reddybacter sp.]